MAFLLQTGSLAVYLAKLSFRVFTKIELSIPYMYNCPYTIYKIIAIITITMVIYNQNTENRYGKKR